MLASAIRSSSSNALAGLSGGQDMREWVRWAGKANSLNLVSLFSSQPQCSPSAFFVNWFFGLGVSLAAGMLTLLALSTSLAISSCGTMTRGSSWMLNARSISGSHWTNFSIMPRK